jgi:hypothetical protein
VQNAPQLAFYGRLGAKNAVFYARVVDGLNPSLMSQPGGAFAFGELKINARSELTSIFETR